VDEAGTATTVARGGPRRRYPWLLLAGGLLLVLVLLTVDVLTDGPLIGTDHRIHTWVRDQWLARHWKWLAHGPTAPARLLVDCARFQVAIPVLVLVAIVLALRDHSPRPLFTAGTGLVLLLATVLPLQVAIGRAYPGHVWHVPKVHDTLDPGTLGSFPSGHEATAVVCYGLAALLLCPRPRRLWGRIGLAVAWLLCIVIGAALIWCSSHWFTDVVAGAALAGLILQATMWLTRDRTVSYPARESTTLPTLPPAVKKS
jgi:membrane-associated phospholipid phosphatase